MPGWKRCLKTSLHEPEPDSRRRSCSWSTWSRKRAKRPNCSDAWGRCPSCAMGSFRGSSARIWSAQGVICSKCEAYRPLNRTRHDQTNSRLGRPGRNRRREHMVVDSQRRNGSTTRRAQPQIMALSADTHVGPRMEDLRPYCPAKYVEAFDEWCNGRLAQASVQRSIFEQTFSPESRNCRALK